MQSTYKNFGDFSLCTGVGVQVIDREGTPLFSSAFYESCAGALRYLDSIFQNPEQCAVSMVYGSYQALRFGGRYIFFCPRGLVHFVSPVIRGGEMSCAAVAGPVLMTDRLEYYEQDISLKWPQVERTRFLREIESVPYRDPACVQALSEQLYLNACSLSDSAYSEGDAEGVEKLREHVSGYIAGLREDAAAGYYPLDKEEELLTAISKGDRGAAGGLLNEILGHIFFQSGSNMEVVRSRVAELIVLLSRAAVKGGADAGLIFDLNCMYLQEIDHLASMDDTIWWLHRVMSRFSDYVFHFADAKHADLIHKAIRYIRQHYHRKLTLEETASHVYLSPPYLSKIFKEETGYNFNTYLNLVRIEQSKKLLRDPGVNLVEISNLVGYEDQSYFSKVFKKMEGISPGKYRLANYL